MGYMMWDRQLELGIDVIDQQHRQIVVYINRLSDAIADKNAAAISEVLEQLIDYTYDHFAFEEQLMDRAGYMLADPHREVHRRFAVRAGEFRRQLEEGIDPISVARKVRTQLQIWLTNHIQHEDANYAPLVRKVLRREASWIGGAIKRIFGEKAPLIG